MLATEIGSKLIAALVLFAATFGSTLLPYKLKNFSSSEYCLKNVSCFCGGLFVGLCFLHLIPDAMRDFNAVPTLKNVQDNYPMAELIFCFGMIIVMVAEKLATVIQSQRDKECEDSKHCCKEQCPEQGERSSLYGSFNQSYQALSTDDNQATKSSFKAEVSNEHFILKDEKDVLIKGPKSNIEKESSTSVRMGNEVRSKIIKTICLVIALMIHSLFEGLTVGLQKSPYGLIALVGVLTFHKSIIGFSLGMAIVHTNRGLKFHLKQAGLFALASPFGIMAGALLVSSKFNFFNDSAMSILICLATGTFLYITFFEILAKNLVGNEIQDLFSFMYFLIGFGIFAGITAIPVMRS